MSRLQQFFGGKGPSRLGKSFAAACAIASGLGVGLSASGQALADEYSRTSGVMPAQMVKVLDVRAMTRIAYEQHSSFNTSRVVGGVVGGLAGRSLTRGKGQAKTVGTLLGAAFGQAVGDSVDKAMDRHEIPVVEFTFSRPGEPNGQVYVVVQDMHDGLKDCGPGATALLVNNREISRCLVAPGNYMRPQAPSAPARSVTLEEVKSTIDSILPDAPVGNTGAPVVKVSSQRVPGLKF